MLRRILQDASDAIVAVDRARSLVLFNTAAEEMFGYLAEEVLGLALETLIPPRFAAQHPAHVSGFMQGARWTAGA